MKVLLDTHTWIWSLLAPEQLSDPARDVIDDGATSIHLSAISFWELAMLAERGAFEVDGDLDAWLAYALKEYPTTELPITSAIALESRRVPLAHRDPADRFLAATARLHDLVLITRDRRLLAADGIPTLAA